MPPFPHDAFGRAAVSAVERLGFVLRRCSKKGHSILARDEVVLSIPDHRRLKSGTLRQILSDAEISPEKFTALL